MKPTLTLTFVLCLAPLIAEPTELTPYRGGPTPALILPDLDGRFHRLEDYRGQVVLVNFWATWCPPCRQEMPSLQRLLDKMAGHPFAILAVDMGEQPQDVKSFLDEVPLRFPILLDRHGKALQAWRVFAFPSTFVVDAHGQIRYVLYGGLEWDSPEVVRTLMELLPGEDGGKRVGLPSRAPPVVRGRGHSMPGSTASQSRGLRNTS